ncbi:MAG: YraN family protein [Candidatus Paracaedibacteraceae bacterium]|nr:YraN family protein [Candidatus Paracaedibacteraceae bacterium]
MKTTYERGVHAEKSALRLLEKKGFTQIAMRYKTPHGEIDLLMQDGATLVAVEVKYRKYEADVFESISTKQQQRIQNALLYYLSEHDMSESGANSSLLRFDVVLISADMKITHIENAW